MPAPQYQESAGDQDQQAPIEGAAETAWKITFPVKHVQERATKNQRDIDAIQKNKETQCWKMHNPS